MISHSLPLGKPAGLKMGTGGKVSTGTAVGEYLGENWSNDRHVPRIPN